MLDEQQLRSGEPLPLLWLVVPNTLDDKNQDMPRLGEDAVWVGGSLNCCGILILADDNLIWGSVCDEDLVVGVDGVLSICGCCCLNECVKRWDFRRRTASFIKFPSSIKRCNKLGKRRFLSLTGQLMWLAWWLWWWCDERFEIEDFQALVADELSVWLFVLLCKGSILLDWRRFKFVVDDEFVCCDCCWPKWRRQLERNLNISVSLS